MFSSQPPLPTRTDLVRINSCVLKFRIVNFASLGWIAQLVEQRTENPRVPGSIPGPATSHRKRTFIGTSYARISEGGKMSSDFAQLPRMCFGVPYAARMRSCSVSCFFGEAIAFAITHARP